MPQDHTPDTGLRQAASPMIGVWRGDMLESRHAGAAVVADADGQVIAHWGDFEQPVYPRSAIKPLQALALVESGAADAFAVTEEELALACASHAGSPEHTTRIAAWLARLGVDETALACGVHRPKDTAAADAMVAAGRTPSPLHNNCSGKHTGMLTTALHKGESLTGYTERTHPVQQRILGILEMMTGQDLGQTPVGRDGCSVPTFAVSLGGLAVAMAQLGNRRALPARRAQAAERVRRAWGRHPDLIQGSDGADTRMIRACGGAVLTKVGAEAVHVACLPAQGLGIALKIADGAQRAGPPALLAILEHLRLLPAAAASALADLRRPRLNNHQGIEIGRIAPLDGFPA